MNTFTALIKPSEAPQRSVETKFKLNFFFRSGIWTGSVKDLIKFTGKYFGQNLFLTKLQAESLERYLKSGSNTSFSLLIASVFKNIC